MMMRRVLIMVMMMAMLIFDRRQAEAIRLMIGGSDDCYQYGDLLPAVSNDQCFQHYLHHRVHCDALTSDSSWSLQTLWSCGAGGSVSYTVYGSAGGCAGGGSLDWREYYSVDCAGIWICPRDHYCPTERQLPISCGAARESTPTSKTEMDCRCRAGWNQINNITEPALCEICPINSWCSNNQIFACGANRTSSMESSLSTSCRCITPLAGEHGADLPCNLCEAGSFCVDGDATICPADSYCPAESSAPISCGGNQTSIAGSQNASACYCQDGWYNVGPSICYICPTGSYCSNGIRYTCSDNGFSSSGTGASSPNQCHCRGRYWGTDGPGEHCTICAAGYQCVTQTKAPCSSNQYCPEGTVYGEGVRCGDHRVSPLYSTQASDCHCIKGYTGPLNNTACVSCPLHFFCNDTNNGTTPMACPALTTTTISDHAATIEQCYCLGGYTGLWDSCTLCPNGSFCGYRTPAKFCPANSICPSGSVTATSCGSGRGSPARSYLNESCACVAGTYGDYGPSLTCNICPLAAYCDRSSTQPIDCPVNSATTIVRATSIANCICSPSYHGSDPSSCTLCGVGTYCPDHTAIILCPKGSWCPSGSIAPISCGGNQTSDVGSVNITACHCGTDSYITGPNTCAVCPANSWCFDGIRTPCDDNGMSNSPAGSTSPFQCKCKPSYYGDHGGLNNCTICEAGSYCSYGYMRNCWASYYCPEGTSYPLYCGAGQISPAGSTNVTACHCDVGYYGDWYMDEQQSNTTMTLTCNWCPAGKWCNGTASPYDCPANSATPYHYPSYQHAITDCACVATYYGSYDQCEICPAGWYCTGGVTKHGCYANYYCTEGSSTYISCPYYTRISPALSHNITDCVCRPGYYASLSTLETSADCTPCPYDQWCDGIVETPQSCPANSIPSYRTSITDCQCIAGYWGAIMNTTSNCTQCQPGDLCPANTRVPTKCPAGYYCPSMTYSYACGSNSISPAGSTSYTQCVCKAGYYAAGVYACGSCPVDHFCSGGEPTYNYTIPTECPSHSTSALRSSSISACHCVAPYHGPNGGPCTNVTASSSSSTSMRSSSGARSSSSTGDASSSTSSTSISLPSSSSSSSMSSSGMATGDQLSDDSSSSTSDDMIVDIISGSTGSASSVMIGIIIGAVILIIIIIASVICYRRRHHSGHDSLLASSTTCSCPCLRTSNSHDSSDTSSSNATIIINNSDHVPVSTGGHTNDDHVEFLPHIGNSEL